MTVDSAYFIKRYKTPGQLTFPFQIESIGDAAMSVYAMIMDEWIEVPTSAYTIEYETVRDPIFKRGIITINGDHGLGQYTEIYIRRYTPRVRDLMVLDQNRFPSNELENQMDKITYMLQELEGHLCDCNTDTVTVRPPAVPIPEDPGGPVDPPTPPTCMVYECDAIEQVVPLDLSQLSALRYWSLGAPQMEVPSGTRYYADDVINADQFGVGTVTVKQEGFPSGFNGVSVNDFFTFDNANNIALCTPEGAGGPGGLRGKAGDDYVLRTETPEGSGGATISVSSDAPSTGIHRIRHTMTTSGSFVIDLSATVRTVSDGQTYNLDVIISLDGKDGFPSNQQIFTDVLVWPWSHGLYKPFHFSWAASLQGGSASATVAINGIQAGTFTQEAYDPVSNPPTGGGSTSIAAPDGSMRFLFLSSGRLTNEDWEKLAIAWERTYTSYVDPDPNCIPPT